MMTHGNEMHKGSLRNFLSIVLRDFLLISGSRKFSNILLRSRVSGKLYKILQYSIPECSIKYYNILLENSLTFEEVSHNSFSFYIVSFK